MKCSISHGKDELAVGAADPRSCCQTSEAASALAACVSPCKVDDGVTSREGL